MVGDPSGNKRLFSNIEAASEGNNSLAQRSTIGQEDELRAFVRENIAENASENHILVSSKWLHNFMDGKTSPVVLAKGSAGKKVANEAYDKLDAWYGTNLGVVALRVKSADNGGFEILDLRVDLSIGDALGEVYGENVEKVYITNTMPEHAGTTRNDVGADVANSTNGDEIATTEQVRELDLDEAASLVATSAASTASSDLALGHIGLGNMGNTCFMNSSLQALMHIPELALYFTSDAYRADLNRTNPIGCGGEVAEAFGELVRELYSTDAGRTASAIRPVLFLRTIGRFNRSFASRMQQDSQEFTAFLLDSLHEDLNRVHDKPVMEKPELADGAEVTDEVVRKLAESSWSAHKKRNDSEIMDIFTGMYKSTLVCPVCDKISITFDPFFDVTLPLPSSNIWTKEVVVVRPRTTVRTQGSVGLQTSSTSSSASILSTTVALPPNSTVLDMKTQIANLVNIANVANLTVADVYDHKFYRLLKDGDTLIESIDSSDEIVLYERSSPDQPQIPVYIRFNGLGAGLPLFINVDENADLSVDSIRSKVLDALHSFRHGASSMQDTGEAVSAISVFEGTIDEIVYGYGGSRLRRLYPSSAPASRNEMAGGEPFISVNPGNPEDEATTKLPTPASSPAPAPYSPTSDSSSSISPLSVSVSPPEIPSEPHGVAAPLDPANIVLVVDVADTSYVPSINEPQKVTNPKALSAAQSLEDNKKTALEDCLRSFSQPEVLGDQDLWYCPRCKEFRKAQKQLEMWRVPDVLMIHLKRFSGMQSLSRKINDLVTFPLENLDMREFISPAAAQLYAESSTDPSIGGNSDLVYDLFAVDNHYGGMGGGHYTAYVKDFSGNWLDFNDSYVSPMDPQNVCSEAAYLLFYKRRSSTASNEQLAQQISQAVRTTRDASPEPSDQRSPPSPASQGVFIGEGNVLGRADNASPPRLPWMDI